MANEPSGPSRIAPLVAGLVIGAALGWVLKPAPSGGGGVPGATACDAPTQHIITVYPDKLSCDAATISTDGSSGVSWQASDRTRALSIVFDKPAPFDVVCSGPYCAAGPPNGSVPSGTTEYRYTASFKDSDAATSNAPTPTPTPISKPLNGRIIIIKP